MFSCKWSHNFVMGAQRGHPGGAAKCGAVAAAAQVALFTHSHGNSLPHPPLSSHCLCCPPLPLIPPATPPLLLLFIRQRKAGTVTTSWNNAPSVLCHNIYIPPAPRMLYATVLCCAACCGVCVSLWKSHRGFAKCLRDHLSSFFSACFSTTFHTVSPPTAHSTKLLKIFWRHINDIWARNERERMTQADGNLRRLSL